MRLIDADAKIMAQLYDEEHEEWVQREMTVADYLSWSDTAIPFVDAVPVVRCRECVYGQYYAKSMRTWCTKLVRWKDGAGFCDDGIRRFDERREDSDGDV